MHLWLLWEWHLVECNIHAWEGTSHGKKWLAMEEHTPFWRAHCSYSDNHGISVLGMGERLWSGLAGLTVGSDSMLAPCIWQLILGLTAHLSLCSCHALYPQRGCYGSSGAWALLQSGGSEEHLIDPFDFHIHACSCAKSSSTPERFPFSENIKTTKWEELGDDGTNREGNPGFVFIRDTSSWFLGTMLPSAHIMQLIPYRYMTYTPGHSIYPCLLLT